MHTRLTSLIFLFLFYAPIHVFGHGAVQRASELKDSEVRLFVADNMDGSVVVVDFPDGEITHRVSTSPSIMILASNKDNKYCDTHWSQMGRFSARALRSRPIS